MNEEQQRIAIAEACGWTDCHFPLASNVELPFTERVVCGIPPGKMTHSPLPDYLNDLNAMREAEKVLTIDQSVRYLRSLELVTNGRILSLTDKTAFMRAMLLIHSTSAQRAESFLRTLNLWTT